MIFFLFLLTSLGIYRVCRFIIADSIIEEPRDRFMRWLMPPPIWSTVPGAAPVMPKRPRFWRRKLHELLTCPYCLSIHGGWIAVLVLMHYRSIPLPLFWWPALSAGSLAAWRYIEHN